LIVARVGGTEDRARRKVFGRDDVADRPGIDNINQRWSTDRPNIARVDRTRLYAGAMSIASQKPRKVLDGVAKKQQIRIASAYVLNG
jgi:hypothetical protein